LPNTVELSTSFSLGLTKARARSFYPACLPARLAAAGVSLFLSLSFLACVASAASAMGKEGGFVFFAGAPPQIIVVYLQSDQLTFFLIARHGDNAVRPDFSFSFADEGLKAQ
jgi:hypothetical protein